MRIYIIRWQTAQGRIVDTKCYGLTAREALNRFRLETTILKLTQRIPSDIIRAVTGIYDATWFDGIDGRPEGVFLHLVE
jgi:hypothetical protein